MEDILYEICKMEDILYEICEIQHCGSEILDTVYAEQCGVCEYREPSRADCGEVVCMRDLERQLVASSTFS